MTERKLKIALADDHALLRNGLAEMITKLQYSVLFQSDNGQGVIERINNNECPDLVLMDINMPGVDGYEATLWLKQHHPQIKVLALSMYDDEASIIRMLKSGARGYILKSAEPAELKRAIENIIHQGYHYSELVTGPLIHSVSEMMHEGKVNSMTERELQFLQLAGTEMTYKEIADRMHVKPRTIDGYREALFEKLKVKSRVGLVLFAIKNRILLVN